MNLRIILSMVGGGLVGLAIGPMTEPVFYVGLLGAVTLVISQNID